MTQEDAKKLKNGQHIKVNVREKWIDALFVKYHEKHGIYAHHMGFDITLWESTGIYGTCNYFELSKVKLPKGSSKK
jgi:hypothetical protein